MKNKFYYQNLRVFLKEKDVETIERFYKSSHFKGTFLGLIKNSETLFSAKEPLSGFQIKKRATLETHPSKEIEKISIPKIEPENCKRIKENNLPNPEIKLTIAKHELEVPTKIKKFIMEKPTEANMPVSLEDNYKKLILGTLTGIALDKLLPVSNRFHISTENMKNHLKQQVLTNKNENSDLIYDESKYKCLNCGKHFKEKAIFERHLDSHFQNLDEKSVASGVKVGRFIDKQKFQNLSFNFVTVERSLIRNQVHRTRNRGKD